MNKILACIVVTLFLSTPLLLSCTKSEDKETEKGSIEKMTDQAAKDMADSITIPLDKARAAKELVEKNYRDMEENLDKQ